MLYFCRKFTGSITAVEVVLDQVVGVSAVIAPLWR